MKQILLKYINIIIFIISIIVSMSMNLNFNNINSFTGNSILYIILVIFYYYILKQVINIKDKRLIICSIIISVIFSTFEIVGQSLNLYYDLRLIIGSFSNFLNAMFRWLGYFVSIYCAISLIFYYISQKEEKNTLSLGSLKIFFITWIVIFIAWIPFFLRYYPGLATIDSMRQIYQSTGIEILSNHHPILHTAVISFFINIGKKVFDSYNIGFAMYNIAQMLFLSGVFAFTLAYMKNKKSPNIFIIISCMFYAFYPINALFSITIWKDIPFAAMMLLFTICVVELSINKERFLQSKIKNLLLLVSILTVILFRNNGIYVIILSTPFIIFMNKMYYKRLLFIFISAFIISAFIKGPVFNFFNIEKGEVKEALSIPMQQLARVYTYKLDSLSYEERTHIQKYIQADNIEQLYNPILSDPIKNYFNSETFSENKKDFIFLWIKLFFKYPLEYIEAFLSNSYGYWYPEASNWVLNREMEKDLLLGLHHSPKIKIDILDRFDSIIEKRHIPFISMMFSIGFTFWIILTCGMYCIYKRKYRLLYIYLPVLFLWLTTLASPVYCEYRYVYSMFTCLPILISTVILENNKTIDLDNYRISRRRKLWRR
jgi:hypothetical protein